VSSDRFESLISQIPAATVFFDVETRRFTYVSRQVEQLLGLSADELMANPELWQRTTDPADRDRVVDRYEEAVANGSVFDETYRFNPPAGPPRWVRNFMVPADPGSTVWKAMIFDVTDQVQADAERELLINQMPAAVMRIDVNRQTVLYASPQVEALTGEPPESWIGEQGYARWAEHILDPQQPDWEELGRRGEAWSNQYRWMRADGVERVFRSVIHVVAPGVAQAAVFDATEEVETERRLAAEQRRYQTLVEQLPMVIMRNAVNGDMEYISPQVEGMLGYSPDEFVEMANSDRWEEVIHPDDRARLHTSIAAFRTDQINSDEFELRLLTSEGDYRNVLFRRSRVDPPEGHWYLQGVAVDITELRDAEARSRSAVAALVRGGEDQQARIAIELHDDTVQVMTAILFQLERTLDVDDPARQTLVEMLRAVIERTRRLMFELRPQLLEKEGLQAMLTEMVKDGPWETAEVDVQIGRQADTLEALLYRTLRELILNARKHSQARSLSVTGRERGGRLTFRVADDGIGFASETALNRHTPGLHLGLTTVIERVRLAGGDVLIQSTPGAGARFTIVLPAEPRQPANSLG